MNDGVVVAMVVLVVVVTVVLMLVLELCHSFRNLHSGCGGDCVSGSGCGCDDCSGGNLGDDVLCIVSLTTGRPEYRPVHLMWPLTSTTVAIKGQTKTLKCIFGGL